MAEKKLTPMLRQYLEVKEQHPDCLVFFRLGDFYEMFFEDAKVGAKELDLTLTTRDRNKPPEEQTPMCGVPHHAVQNYVSKLTAKGYKVVICEQLEDPAAAVGLVDRGVVKIVTPGTVVEGDTLSDEDNNFLCGAWWSPAWCGLCFCDLSTGETEALAVRLPDDLPRLYSELESRRPREVVFAQDAWTHLRGELELRLRCHCERYDEAAFTPLRAKELMEGQFSRQEGDLPDDQGKEAALRAVGGLLAYLYETQRTQNLPHLNVITFSANRSYMELDRATRRNLELTETLREKEKRGSLLWVMDRCRTPMGHRRLRAWLERPLVDPERIAARQKAVSQLVDDPRLREELRRALGKVGDLERMVARLGCGGGGARELLALADALEPIPQLMGLLEGCSASLLQVLLGELDGLESLADELRRAITRENLPATVREGGIIARGYHPQVDRYRDLLDNSGQAILDLEARERERTGFKGLKVKYNKVFGYYIELSNAFKGEIPQDYIRKQTLVNGERYVTPELKTLEEEILNARELCARLEYDLFCRLRDMVAEKAPLIQRDGEAVAQLDVLAALAALAVQERYVCPQVDGGRALDIVGGRHPVVEQTLKEGLFVPNDLHMEEGGPTLALITGPNMAGKSTYMRQAGLIVLMAQMGSFVPAKSAHIGVVDRVFTRIGASDDLAAGQSTFMVEMTEVAQILREATSRSLVLMDEIGRGTSTYDGLYIARSVLEYCADVLKAKTLFSTHYHELIQVAEGNPGAANYNIAAEKRRDKVVFLRKILPGGADESYGVEVAKLAGVPEPVVKRAAKYLRDQEAAALAAKKPVDVKLADGTTQKYSAWAVAAMKEMQELREMTPHEKLVLRSAAEWYPKDLDLITTTYATGLPVLERLSQVDLDNMTPVEALALVAELKENIRRSGWKWEL